MNCPEGPHSHDHPVFRVPLVVVFADEESVSEELARLRAELVLQRDGKP